MIRSAAVLPLLAGCGASELARLEVEQRALQREVEVLRRHVETMRAEMQANGMLPSGPAGAAQAAPESGLSGELTFSVERFGEVPALPDLPDPERREETSCGWRFHVPWLSDISDLTLDKSGSGKSSPIVLAQDGEALQAHAAPPKYEKQCAGAFRVQPKYIFFSPASADAVGGTWTIELDPRVPVPRGGDDRGMYWVYPGTTLTFTFESGWKPEWGPMELTFDARLLPVGTPEKPNEVPRGVASVTALGEEATGSQNRLGLSVSPPPPDGAWTLDVSTPSDGPYVLIETLILGNDEHALVVAGGSQ